MFLLGLSYPSCFSFFFFNDTATTEIYTLSLHDALPILLLPTERRRDDAEDRDITAIPGLQHLDDGFAALDRRELLGVEADRKSTRLNSSHLVISYAVFCLKKKKTCGRQCR